jgi:hypothetical protein
MTTAVALAVLLVVAASSVVALRRRPGSVAGQDFLHVWRFSPWGKQFMLDFYGLEVILALWMLGHATSHDALGLAVVCIVLMPVFGAMAAAAYWLLAVGG